MKPKDYMLQALELARQALDTGDVPVGCVVVQGERVVGRGRNPAGRKAKCPFSMPRSKPSMRPAGLWAAGGFPTALCM